VLSANYPNDPEIIAAWPFSRCVAAHDLLDAVEAAQSTALAKARERAEQSR
jgi:hypothetical protein